MKGDRGIQPHLTDLNLKDTNLSRDAGVFLCELLASNTTICKVNIEFNSNVSAQVLTDVTKACKRNRQILKHGQIPKA